MRIATDTAQEYAIHFPVPHHDRLNSSSVEQAEMMSRGYTFHPPRTDSRCRTDTIAVRGYGRRAYASTMARLDNRWTRGEPSMRNERHTMNKKPKLPSLRSSFPSLISLKIIIGSANFALSADRQLLLTKKAAVSVILVDIASVNDGGE